MAKKPTFVDEVPEELGGDEPEGSSLPTVRILNDGSLINANAAEALDITGVRIPYLTITHGVGAAAANFNPGDLVLAKEHLVCPKGKDLTVIIVNILQYYKQRVSNDDWNAGVRPTTFASLEEARAAGMQTEWVNGVGPDVSPAMDMTLLVRKPDGVVSGLFGIDIGDGEEYAICRFSSDKTAYSYAFNDIALIAKMKLAKSGLYSASWKMTTELSKPSKKGNRTQIARFAFSEMLDPDVIAGIQSAVGAPSNG